MAFSGEAIWNRPCLRRTGNLDSDGTKFAEQRPLRLFCLHAHVIYHSNMLQSDLTMTNSEKALQSWCFRLFWHSSTQNRLRCLSLPWFRVWCRLLMPKAPKMVTMALVMSLLALPAFGVRQEGAMTFSDFKRRMKPNGHVNMNTKLATINALRPRALFQRIQL